MFIFWNVRRHFSYLLLILFSNEVQKIEQGSK